MLVDGHPYRTVWMEPGDPRRVRIIDQRRLPFVFEIEDLTSVEALAEAIRDMHVRGAGCIGATAAFGMVLAAWESSREPDFAAGLKRRAALLAATRPTAVNLHWAINRMLLALAETDGSDTETKIRIAQETAQAIADEDAAACREIGGHGLEVFRHLAGQKKPGEALNVLTHCNAGWLAFVDHGSATAPIYAAHRAGLPVHVWVDETRPRNQGARLTAWELAQEGVPHTVIADNTGGHLMQHGLVDAVIVGTDRTTRSGDVANKIGTYLKALAARDNAVPFYVALPSSSFDWKIDDGVRDIPIEERGGEEVSHLSGWRDGGEATVQLVPCGTKTANYAFDVTPARLVTALITERGVCEASAEGIRGLFPEQAVMGH